MRYLVFGGKEYYPCGGMDDLVASFDDLEEALCRMRLLRQPDPRDHYCACDWCHVYDVKEGTTRYLSDFE